MIKNLEIILIPNLLVLRYNNIFIINVFSFDT